jgi:prepilin-type N-terminal cleavage/methylation domain-containing protein
MAIPMTSVRKGFTLIELLIVVVIIGILAAIAIPKFEFTKGKANVSAIKSDLRNLMSAQESYYYDYHTYATDLSQLSVGKSKGVDLEIFDANQLGWAATATHPQAYPLTCGVYVAGAPPRPPATIEGLIGCANIP